MGSNKRLSADILASFPAARWLPILLCFVSVQALALTPSRMLTQYGHTAWHVQDGELGGAVTSVTQTSDGYLWVGTRAGLLRFNGAEFLPLAPTLDEPLRSPRVLSLLAARDGSLWIGTGNDLEHWQGSRLTHYPAAVGYIAGYINDIEQTKDGSIWVARSRVSDSDGPLCRVERERLRCFGEKDGISLPYVVDVLETPEGELLIRSDSRIARWNPTTSISTELNVFNDSAADGIQSLAFDSDGTLLIGTAQANRGGGLLALNGGKPKALVRGSFNGADVPVQTIMIDSHQNLWIGTLGYGVYRVSQSRVDRFGSADGLSSDSVNKIFEDREGNIWVATQGGIDRFREMKVPSYSAREGLSADLVSAVLAASDGSIWISNWHALDVLANGAVTSFRAGAGLPGEEVTSLFEDSRHRIWVGVDDALYLYENRLYEGGKFRMVTVRDDPIDCRRSAQRHLARTHQRRCRSLA